MASLRCVVGLGLFALGAAPALGGESAGLSTSGKGIDPKTDTTLTGLQSSTITELYSTFLGREPDKSGLSHYRSESVKGVGVAQIADELLQSEEFRKQDHNGSKDTPVEFAQAVAWRDAMSKHLVAEEDVFYMYRKLLGRAPDSTAAKAFKALIEDPSKELSVYDMASDMMRSEEFSVVYWYWKILLREPDSEGRRHFAELIAGTATQTWPLSAVQIADELLRGKEFLAAQGLASAELQKANKARALLLCRELVHFPLTVKDVTFLYIKVLGRWPDTEANTHYQEVVSNGEESIMQLLVELLASDEYQAQGALALPKDDYLAYLVKSVPSDVEGAPKWKLIDECVSPIGTPEPSIVQASALFLTGQHPSIKGSEKPNAVDHHATKSKLGHKDGVR